MKYEHGIYTKQGRYVNTGVSYYRAACRCGWKGARHLTRAAATAEGDRHLEQATKQR